ncbi:MAG TPA: hypothetical protein VII56_17110 [Rhizomicrobium sp.]
MLRLISGVVAGVVGWIVVAFALSFLLRAVAPDVSAALNVHATTAALAGRLAISFISSLLGGLAAALVSAERSRAPLIAGALLLLCWGYYHVTMIWHQFPLWYHLTFLVSLPLLSLLGGRFARAR